jgi:ABC-type dipeptide/oligopeptide/nickel transport system permease subunit
VGAVYNVAAIVRSIRPPDGRFSARLFKRKRAAPQRSHPLPMNSSRPSINWPLWLGGCIVGLLVITAVVGPTLAPRDPLERTLIAEIGGRVRGTPFPPFQSWEFPLGSDRFGRDLFSRLIWAVRPTLILVAIVALVRLTVGVLLGMIAGWSNRGGARALSGLINAALAIPVLIVALAAITAIGDGVGLPAFIIGMALTGWAETAQTVRAQTQLVATQPYIQAARALGANGPQIMLRHISRHIGPLLTTLLAFEISASLMLTAALAFLGYFIGGGVWIITSGELIPVAERVAGMPELGQLVGTAEVRISTRPPWEMIFPGTVIVIAILGFNLLGEGLRRRQSRLQPAQPLGLARVFSTFIGRVEAGALTRVGQWDDRAARRVYAFVGVALLAGCAWIGWQLRPVAPATAQQAVGSVLPRAPGWPAQRGDPYGTLRGNPTAPPEPTLQWEFAAPGLAAPAVGSDGLIYVAGTGALYALAPDGAVRWEAALAADPVGAPALAPDGSIYVTDRSGGLYAFSADGTERWAFQSSYRAEVGHGPMIGRDGTIYYGIIDTIQAVNPDGTARWISRDSRLPYQEHLPRLNPAGDLVFLKSSVFDAATGSLLPITIVPDEPIFAESAFLVGADGRTYYRSDHRVIPWRRVEAGVAVQPALSWAAGNAFVMPADAGVTAQGAAWLLYTTDFADMRLVWIGADSGLLGEGLFPLRSVQALAAHDDASLQVCGLNAMRRMECALFSPGIADEPQWRISFDRPNQRLVGSAVTTEGMYLVTSEGRLYAFAAP